MKGEGEWRRIYATPGQEPVLQPELPTRLRLRYQKFFLMAAPVLSATKLSSWIRAP